MTIHQWRTEDPKYKVSEDLAVIPESFKVKIYAGLSLIQTIINPPLMLKLAKPRILNISSDTGSDATCSLPSPTCTRSLRKIRLKAEMNSYNIVLAHEFRGKTLVNASNLGFTTIKLGIYFIRRGSKDPE